MWLLISNSEAIYLRIEWLWKFYMKCFQKMYPKCTQNIRNYLFKQNNICFCCENIKYCIQIKFCNKHISKYWKKVLISAFWKDRLFRKKCIYIKHKIIFVKGILKEHKFLKTLIAPLLPQIGIHILKFSFKLIFKPVTQ